jgi:hypothetical protein
MTAAGAHRHDHVHRAASPHEPNRLAAQFLICLTVSAALLAALLLPDTAGAADTSPPTEPGTITVTAVTTSSAKLHWIRSNDNIGIEGYRVYRGPAAAADTALRLIATTDATNSYTAAKLYSGTQYKFGITAIDAADNQSPMRTTLVTTSASSDVTSPAPPSSTSVSAKAFSASRIDVVWAASTSTDVAGYLISRDGTQVGRVDLPSGLHFSDNGLTASSIHSYVINAVDSAGNISTGTTARKATTLAAGAVIIARGPYLSNVLARSAVISWWTNIPTPGAVGWGTASATEHAVTDPAGSVQHHQVTVSGLAAGTSYIYSVTSGSAAGSGTLRTAAKSGQTFSFAAIGDFGGQSVGESQNAANIRSSGTQFVQTLGDNIYPAAGLPDPNFSTTYSDFDARFFKQFGAVVRSQAFFPANGNKEYYGDGEFWAAFPMLGANHSWYSYNWGDAHITVLDAEQPVAPGSAEYSFLQSDLAGAQSAKWRIVALQRPPYSSSSANASSVPVRQYLVPLFDQYKVALVLSGNSHNYERSKVLKAGSVVPAGGVGTTYIVSGAGGNGFNKFTIAAPDWSAFREASYYEYAKVTVSATSIRVDAIRADTNQVFDTTTIN